MEKGYEDLVEKELELALQEGSILKDNLDISRGE